MVRAVEVVVCDLLPYSNGTLFCPKMIKIMSFWPKMAEIECLLDFSPNYVLPFPNFVFNIIFNTL